MAFKRQFFEEITEACMYHPKKGCVHPADEVSGKFVSSLIEKDKRHGDGDRHAPALDIDFPTAVWESGERTRILITGPRPTQKALNDLLTTMVSVGLMSSTQADRERRLDNLGRRRKLPALILSVEATINPSSTPGHFHLYLEKSMDWDSYWRLLEALCAAEVIGKNFRDMCVEWRASLLLKPGIKKKDLKVERRVA